MLGFKVWVFLAIILNIPIKDKKENERVNDFQSDGICTWALYSNLIKLS